VNGRDVASVLSEIATLAELRGENPFRTRAFANAARLLEGTDADLEALAAADELTALPGIGPGIAEVIRELVETGGSTMHDELRATVPPGLFDLLRIPGLGAKRIHKLHEALGIDSLAALEEAAQAGRIAALSGFGAKTEAKLLDGVAFVRSTLGQRRYPGALDLAARLVDWLRAQPGVEAAEIVGALRRRVEVVPRIDLLVCASDADDVLRRFSALNGVAAVTDEPAAGSVSLRLADGMAARLRCVGSDAWVGAVVWETGSEEHLRELAAHADARGDRYDEHGLHTAGGARAVFQREAELYDALGLQYIAPELREGRGEVAAAAAGALPKLVELADLRGTFHCHTTYSDGRATLEEMAAAAASRGWKYLGIADHSRTASYAGGLSPAAVKKQHAEIDAYNRSGGAVRLFKGIESDILSDGSLDYPDDVLAGFDYVVGSVHSGFQMSEREMTDRLLRAIENPHLTMLGHLTGRLLLVRDGYAVDVRAVIDAAAAHGVAIEINADPHRLDLDWRHVRYAAEQGVVIPINPDAHSTAGLDNVAFGVDAARKGWLEPRHVLNTWTTEDVAEYFAKRKQNRQA
jgi:DNA polymerase (family X)